MLEGIKEWTATIRSRLFETIAEQLSTLPKESKVLDVGTGKGVLPIKIAQKNPHLYVYAVDISEKAIKEAISNSSSVPAANRPKFELGSVLDLPFEDNCFDTVVSTFSLHHWPNPAEGLNEIHRVLKPGGEAWIYDHWRNPSKEARDGLRKEYGWWLGALALLHLKLVRSSLTDDEAISLMHNPILKFEHKQLKHRRIFLLLKLKKSSI